MEQEFKILTHLQEHEITTQRRIASGTGISLGAVNLLLKNMVHKGLIKVEKLNARTVRYILTPQGIREKTSLTYQYVRRAYRQIVGITGVVEELARNHQDLKQVILFGPADEVEQILKSCLHDLGLRYRVCRPEGEPPRTPDQLVLTWRHEEEERVPCGSRVYNIMKLL